MSKLLKNDQERLVLRVKKQLGLHASVSNSNMTEKTVSWSHWKIIPNFRATTENSNSDKATT